MRRSQELPGQMKLGFEPTGNGDIGPSDAKPCMTLPSNVVTVAFGQSSRATCREKSLGAPDSKIMQSLLARAKSLNW